MGRGRLRNPATQTVYAQGSEPALFLARGYTGHEHLAWFGLVNMNARLYDPLLGRFLSPDPYVQAPDFTQNFNRYTYCVNNPLVYIDQDGELIWFIIGGALIGSYIGASIKGKNFNPAKWEGNWWQGALWGAGIGAAAGAVAGSVWAAGGVFKITASFYGSKSITIVSVSKVAAETATITIGGTTAATSIAAYTLGKKKENKKDEILKSFETTSTAISGGAFAATETLNQSTKAFREMETASKTLDLGLDYSRELSKVSNWSAASKWTGAVSGLLNMRVSGYQFNKANTFEKKVEYGFDTFMGGVGVFGGPHGAGISLYWEPLENHYIINGKKKYYDLN